MDDVGRILKKMYDDANIASEEDFRREMRKL